MKGLIKKVRENKKGFTLAELLVVVAIVGILVAISIPVFTAQLSKARKATNQANLRAAKAAAVAEYLTDEDVSVSTNDGKAVYYTYDISAGTATKGDIKTLATPEGYTPINNLDEDVTGDYKYTDIQVALTINSDDNDSLGNAEVTLYAKNK